MKIDKIQINDYQNIVNLNKKNNLESLDKADWENIGLITHIKMKKIGS